MAFTKNTTNTETTAANKKERKNLKEKRTPTRAFISEHWMIPFASFTKLNTSQSLTLAIDYGATQKIHTTQMKRFSTNKNPDGIIVVQVLT